MSFILKTQIKPRTNQFLGEKTQKDTCALGEIAIGAISIAIGAISIGEIAIAISPISIASEIAIAIARSGDRRFARDRRDRDRNLADFDDRD